MARKYRYNLELSATLDRDLAEQAQRMGISKSEVMRRALGTFVVLAEEVEKGNKLLLSDGNGQQREVIIASR